MSSLIDKLEWLCTYRSKKLENKKYKEWQLWLTPLWRLKPTDSFSFNLVLLQSFRFSMFYICLKVLTLILVWVALFHNYPTALTKILHDPTLRHIFLTHIYHKYNYYPFLPFIVFAMMFLFLLPRYYFWNRRARWLNAEHNDETIPEPIAASADPSIWPPPPISSS